MKFQKSAITLVTIMALAAANTAFANVLCLRTTDEGNGLVSMPITSDGAGGFTSNASAKSVGGVTTDVTDCTIGKTSCTVSATGTPGGSVLQNVVFGFADADSADKECPMSKLDGLPVEVSKYSVE